MYLTTNYAIVTIQYMYLPMCIIFFFLAHQLWTKSSGRRVYTIRYRYVQNWIHDD